MNDGYFCGQMTHRLSVEEAKWPGANPRLPWHVDLSGYQGNMSAATVLEAFRLAWLWWAEAANIEPVMVQTAGEALVRKHFARIDGPSGTLAWSELANNTMQPKTQRYDSGDTWILTHGNMTGGIDLARVACHEIGHVLGLEHDGQNSGALMAPFISNSVPKPTERDISRLLGLGYTKRTTPIPTPTPGGVPLNTCRFKTALAAGDHGNFALGSAVGIGDYLMLLSGDGPPPTPPTTPTDEPTRRRQLRALIAFARAEGRDDVANEIERAVGTIPFLSIIMALLPFILAMFSGQPIDWAKLMEILLGLFTLHA